MKITELPPYLKEAISKLESMTLWAGYRSLLPSDHPIFEARDKLADAIQRYANESREVK